MFASVYLNDVISSEGERIHESPSSLFTCCQMEIVAGDENEVAREREGEGNGRPGSPNIHHATIFSSICDKLFIINKLSEHKSNDMR